MKNFAKILKSIRPLKHRYSTLGIQLGVDLNEIKKFERQQGNAERCLSEVLSYWLNEGEDAPDKQTLWDALEEVGNKGLAQQLKEEYKGCIEHVCMQACVHGLIVWRVDIHAFVHG